MDQLDRNLNRPLQLVLVAILMMLPPTASAADDSLFIHHARPPLVVDDEAASLGCSRARGAFIVSLRPDQDVILLSRRSFPGGKPIGEVRKGEASISLNGASYLFGVSEDVPDGETIWGARGGRFDMIDRGGCINVDKTHFTTVDDLWTYVHWLVEEVYLPIPPELRGDEVFGLGKRSIDVVLSSDSIPDMRIRGREFRTYVIRDGGVEHRIVPFVVDPEKGIVAARLYSTYLSKGSRVESEGLILAENAVIGEPVRVAMTVAQKP